MRGNRLACPANRASCLRSIPACAGEPCSSVRISVRDTVYPACAGEPNSRMVLRSQVAVYPRVCGGTRCRLQNGRRLSGLSPRVRGNHVDAMTAVVEIRSIPACAGEPLVPASPASPGAVYPRVCGGTMTTMSRCITRRGLSPRVRGNRSNTSLLSRLTRSIPACAGEPCCRRCPGTALRVYPRVCGGTKYKAVNAEVGEGLSPRVQGNPGQSTRVMAPRGDGSIPACAGEPSMVPSRRMSTGGTGSIPACAGEPFEPLNLYGLLPPRVYPRVCGGTTLAAYAHTGGAFG